MKKYLLLTTALAVMGGNAWAETSEFTCPSGSASTLHCFTCGGDCTMTLDTSTGHAVVEGTGEMEGDGGAYGSNYSAWGKYQNSFKSLEVKEGITSIGGSAFQATKLETVNLPDTLKIIGPGAFIFTSIKQLDIPDSVTAIGDWALGISTLKELVIPDSVKEIGYAAFYSSGIQNLTIPDTLVLKNLCEFSDCGNIGRTFDGIQNVTCAGGGNTAKCDALLAQTGKNIQSTSRPNYLLDENGNIVERYQYDADGNKYTTATYEYNEDGKLIREYNEDGKLIREYNGQGELIATYGYDNNGKQYLLTADGKLSLKNADGSTSIYNKDGELVGIKGKKIYTVEEAEAVTAHGDKFHVSLTYK